jgi:hypothetical protein
MHDHAKNKGDRDSARVTRASGVDGPSSAITSFQKEVAMTKSNVVVAAAVVGLAAVLAGCSSADPPAPTGGSTSSPSKPAPSTPAPAPSGGGTATSEQNDTSPGPDSAAVDCVPEGTKGNALGVGAYCQAAADCKTGTFCTAGLAPKGAEFCTAFCSTDADCGEGASCYTDPRGRACAPTACIAQMSK